MYLCKLEQIEGTQVPFFIVVTMIDKLHVLEVVQDHLAGSDKFMVGMKITPDNRIFVDIDGDNGVDIDDCIELSRAIESSLNRDEEDFELNVSSAGADSPLKMARQYKKNVGRTLHVLTNEGSESEGRLTEADDIQFTIETAKSKKQAAQQLTYRYADVKRAQIVLEF